MKNYKIIFTGPVGAGKTTAIASLSDIAPVKTDEVIKGFNGTGKTSTTVAMDYGLMRIGSDVRVHLYGTPGQKRFDFMWDILSTGGGGLVLLLNNTRPDPVQDMCFFLEAFKRFIDPANTVIGVTQMDLKATPTLEDYYTELPAGCDERSILRIDARAPGDVMGLMRRLFHTIDLQLESDDFV